MDTIEFYDKGGIGNPQHLAGAELLLVGCGEEEAW